MSVFFPKSNVESPVGTIFYDNIAAFERSWNENRAIGNTFFCVACATPLYLKIYFKPPNKRLIDQFSYVNIKCLNSLPEIIETGEVETSDTRLNLTDCNALECYANEHSWLVSLPNFEQLQSTCFKFCEPSTQTESQFYLFDSEKPQPTKTRTIKKITLLSVRQPEISGFNGIFTDKIECDTDLIVYNDILIISRGNYEPFVVNENINFPQNTIIFREESFNKFLTKKDEV